MRTFSWCKEGRHDTCHRSYERFYIDGKNKVVYTGEVVKCECTKRGCKCYVKRDERTKHRKTRRKS